MDIPKFHVREGKLLILVWTCCLLLQHAGGFALLIPRQFTSAAAKNFFKHPHIRCSRRLELWSQEQRKKSPADLETKYNDDTGSSSMTWSQSVVGGPSLVAKASILGVAALYGTNYGCVKILHEALPTSTVAGLRFTFAALALTPLLAKMRREAIVPGLEIGALVALGYVAQAIGLETSDAGRAAFLCSLSAVVCPVLAALDGRPMRPGRWAAVCLALLGVGSLELGAGVGGGTSTQVGDLWLLLQPLGYGAAYYKTEKALRTWPDQAGPLTALQILVVALCAVGWAAADWHGVRALEPIAAALRTPTFAAALLWTGLVTTAFTTLVETRALRHLTSGEATLLYSTEPVWGAAFAHVVLGERLGPGGILGGGLILAACLTRFLDSDETPQDQDAAPAARDSAAAAAADEPPAAVARVGDSPVPPDGDK